MKILVVKKREAELLADLLELQVEQLKEGKVMSTTDGSIGELNQFLEIMGTYDEQIYILRKLIRRLKNGRATR